MNMSCCDGSVVEIINLSGQELTLVNVDHTSGSTHCLSDNETSANDGFILGFAYSGSGTNGNAAGTVNLSIASQTLALPYAFTQNSGICTPTSSSDAVSSTNYVATPTFHTGQNPGEASIVWTITSQLG
jgi:hypothetical protein